MFLDDVRVPVANRVGAENDGWRVTNVTLRFERGTAFAGELVLLQRFVAELVALARQTARWDDPALRREIGHMAAEIDALWAMVKLSVCRAAQTGMPGLEGSAIKLHYSELYQRMTELAMEILGPYGQLWDEPTLADREQGWPKAAVGSRAYSIFSGTSEIQRNIIAERILALPRA